MTAPLQRQELLGLIEAACRAGARLMRACALVGLSGRTVERWRMQSLQAEIKAPSSSLSGSHLAAAGAPSATAAPPDGDMWPPVSADRRVAGLRRPVTPPNKLSQRRGGARHERDQQRAF